MVPTPLPGWAENDQKNPGRIGLRPIYAMQFSEPIIPQIQRKTLDPKRDRIKVTVSDFGD